MFVNVFTELSIRENRFFCGQQFERTERTQEEESFREKETEDKAFPQAFGATSCGGFREKVSFGDVWKPYKERGVRLVYLWVGVIEKRSRFVCV